MNIIVCVKQVPDVDDIKWTKENNLDRSAMLSKINQQDEWALDWAMNIKTKFKDVRVCAISMGPMQAKEVLNIALAKGADRAILLSDKLFSGSDTLATAKILSSAIRKYVNNFDLIITGQMAQDGDTAQVPVSIAQMLDIIDVIGVSEIYNADKNCAIVAQKNDINIDIFEVQTPCLLAVCEPSKHSITPKIDDYILAQNKGVEIYNAQDLNLSKEEVGIMGSPTMVYRAYRPEYNKETKEIKSDYAKNILDFLARNSK